MSLPQSAAPAAGQQATGTAESAARNAGRARRLAWSAWALAIALFAFSLILAYVSNPASLVDNFLVNGLGTPTLFAYATVGAIIAARHPENPIGWIFCAAAILVAFGSFAEEYARYAL